MKGDLPFFASLSETLVELRLKQCLVTGEVWTILICHYAVALYSIICAAFFPPFFLFPRKQCDQLAECELLVKVDLAKTKVEGDIGIFEACEDLV